MTDSSPEETLYHAQEDKEPLHLAHSIYLSSPLLEQERFFELHYTAKYT